MVERLLLKKRKKSARPIIALWSTRQSPRHSWYKSECTKKYQQNTLKHFIENISSSLLKLLIILKFIITIIFSKMHFDILFPFELKNLLNMFSFWFHLCFKLVNKILYHFIKDRIPLLDRLGVHSILYECDLSNIGQKKWAFKFRAKNT